MAKSDAVGREISAAAGAAAKAAEGEQLDLMPPTRSNLTKHEQARVETAIKHDRAGRPAGSQNKATREMLDFVRKMMGDPLERRFRWAMHTPETLSIALGCTKLEAFDRLDKIWADLARYFYAQQSPVDGQGNTVTPRLTMVIGGQGAGLPGAPAAGQPPWMYLQTVDAETQQNQALLASDKPVSHGDVSHGDEN